MPYTRVWTRNNPPGTQAANTADDEIRNFRQDVEERMAALVTGWTTGSATDPVVPIDVIKGDVTGKTISIHHSAFRPDDFVSSWTQSDAKYIERNSSSAILRAALILPPVVVITGVSFLVNRNGSNNMTCKLSHISDDVTPLRTDLTTVLTTINGVSLIFDLTLNHTVQAGFFYFLEITMLGAVGSNPRFYGARVAYNTPDCRRTL